jgi:hypothetical protein
MIGIPNVPQSAQLIAGPKRDDDTACMTARSNVNALPEQFFDTRISLASVCPETALMYAVVEDALLCFQETFAGSPHQQRCRAQEAATRWFFSDDQHSPYSFVSICAGLTLDPEEIRNKLRYLEQDIRAKRYPAKRRSIARNNDS